MTSMATQWHRLAAPETGVPGDFEPGLSCRRRVTPESRRGRSRSRQHGASEAAAAAARRAAAKGL